MSNYIVHRSDTYLQHYGVPGTHWGVRRYQNPDGSYKPGAEGRYAPNGIKKGTISGEKHNAKSHSDARQFMSIGGNSSKASKNDDSSSKSAGGGGSSSATEETGEKKKIDRKNIHLYDVSEKLPEKGEKSKKSGGGGGRGSSKKGSEEKSEGKGGGGGGGGSSEEKVAAKEKLLDKEKTAPFKPDAFYNRVKKLDFESLTDSDVSEIDNLIKQYQAYVSSNSYSDKKKKIIGEFIQKYASWKKNRKKNNKQTGRIMEDKQLFIKETKHADISDYELYHFGIRGMKWGVRRFQNEDGSYKSGAEGRYDPDGQPGPNTGKQSSSSDGKKTVTQAVKKEKAKTVKKGKLTKEEKEYNKALMKQKKEDARAKRGEKLDRDNHGVRRAIADGIGRGILKNIALNAANNVLSKSDSKAAYLTRLGINAAGIGYDVHNIKKTVKQVRDVKAYRKQKKVQHSDYSEYELYHHGILGMKWGIRRYQKEDGTLTSAGKKRYRTDDDLNDKGETRKSVIDRLNKEGSKYEKLTDTYYNKSELKKDKDDFDNSIFRKALWSTQKDENGNWTYDSEKGYKDRLEWKKRNGLYSEDKDTNLKRSRTYENKAYEARSDAEKLGVHYQRNKAITDALVSATASALLAGSLSSKNSGKNAAIAALAGGLTGASLGALAGHHGRKKAEKKYGFR